MTPAAPSDSGESSLAVSEVQAGVLIVCFVITSFFLRTWFAWDRVFAGSFVRFSEGDAWYHLRLTESLLNHFPFSLTYDAYLKYPGGQDVPVAPGFDFLLAGFASVVARGSPPVELLERVAAVVPALLGALIVVPVYSLGRSLFTQRAGLVGAALIAVLPGQFLMRSTLGFTDHHVAEVLFSTVTLALFVRALAAPPDHRWMRYVLPGIGLALYLLMWSGGAILVFTLSLAVAFDMILAHIRGDPASRAAVPSFVGAIGIAGVIAVPALWRFSFARYHLVALVGGMACVTMLAVLSRELERLRVARAWYPVAAGAVAACLAGVFVRLAPDTVSAMAIQVSRLTASSPMGAAEAAPLLASDPWWPFFLFNNFGVALPLAIIGLVSIGRRVLRNRHGGQVVLATWFIVSLAAMIGQLRFAYYLAIPVAVLTGFACDRLLARFKKHQDVVFVMMVLLVFVPAAQLARAQTALPPKPSDDWYAALRWMRENTPEPLESAAYLDRYAGMSEARPYPYSESAYGVLSWWNPGHWIIRIARRLPNANPTQANAGQAARFFLATDEATARTHLDALASRYVIVSSEMPAWPEPDTGHAGGYFSTMVRVAGGDQNRFYDVFHERNAEGAWERRVLYYPDYYRTMLTRLYAWGGRQARPRESAYVAIYHEELATSGNRRKVLLSLRPAGSYDEAVRMVAREPQGRARVVGLGPLDTCVPIEALDALKPVYGSPTTDARSAARGTDPAGWLPAIVQIFEYQKQPGNPARPGGSPH